MGCFFTNKLVARCQIQVVALGKQIQQFATVCSNITKVLGKAKADELLSRSIFIISAGSNDIFEYSENRTVLPAIFMDKLVEAYTTQIEVIVDNFKFIF